MNFRSEGRAWVPEALRDTLNLSICRVRCAQNRKGGEIINMSICQKMILLPGSAFPRRVDIATGPPFLLTNSTE